MKTSTLTNRFVKAGLGMVAGLIAPVTLVSTPSHAAQRVAMLIGNSDYPDSGLFADLVNPSNDVKLLRNSLQRVGFDVLLLENGNRSQMLMKIAEFQDLIEPGGVAVFYFAGHGIQYDGENYLMGSNAELKAKYMLGDEALSANTVLAALTEKKPKTALLFLDCCRQSPPKSWMTAAVPGDYRSYKTRGLAEMRHPDAVISYAASPDQAALDGSGLNSPYAESLSRWIGSGQELMEVLRGVGNDVHKTTNHNQRPWWNASLLDKFYFTTDGVPPAAPGTTIPAALPSTLLTTGQPAVGPGTVGFTPILPLQLPAGGFFSNDDVFEGSNYARYNQGSKRSILKQAQSQLGTAGSPDGQMGRNTQSAILAYQEQHSLPVTGRLDEATLTTMGLVGRTEVVVHSSTPSSGRGQQDSAGSKKGTKGNFDRNQFIRNMNDISGTAAHIRSFF